MKTLGIDIGTTNISIVVVKDGATVDSVTAESGADIHSHNPWERIQDADKIRKTVIRVVDSLISKHRDLQSIGLTGQQHGIVYLDVNGNAVSNLITWQDGRGNLPLRDGHTYCEYIFSVTGYKVHSGYGLVTHFYNQSNGLAPGKAVRFCTIQDYVARNMTGGADVYTDTTDAASLGLFDLENLCFDAGALDALGIDRSFLPALAVSPVIGEYRGIPVCVPIGDNQASFMAAAGRGKMLVNVGTGSQFSVHSDKYMVCEGLETRPYPTGGYLVVGAALCGGGAFALLDRFFREVIFQASGDRPEHCYDLMEKMASDIGESGDIPCVSPLFCGTRNNPSMKASVTGLDEDNFTPGHLVQATLEGIADELFGMYARYREAGGEKKTLCGSGNGILLNPRLKHILERRFGTGIQASGIKEEAACGAAAFASINCKI